MRLILKAPHRKKAEGMVEQSFAETWEKSKDQSIRLYILLFQEIKGVFHRFRDRNWRAS